MCASGKGFHSAFAAGDCEPFFKFASESSEGSRNCIFVDQVRKTIRAVDPPSVSEQGYVKYLID